MKIEVVGWERNGEDYNGKEQYEVFFITFDGGREKAVGKADMLKAIKMNLPNRGEEHKEPETPLFNRGNGVEV